MRPQGFDKPLGSKANAHTLTDEEILERLLALNLARAGQAD